MTSEPAPPADSDASPTADEGLNLAWRRLMVLFHSKRDELFQLMRDHNLTPPHGLALGSLAMGPRRMRDLADEMNCDASYITAIVDRLEDEGLAVRTADPTDRRVKVIALTPRGLEVGAAITAVFATPPPQLQGLTAAERAEFGRLIAKVAPHDDSPFHPFGTARP